MLRMPLIASIDIHDKLNMSRHRRRPKGGKESNEPQSQQTRIQWIVVDKLDQMEKLRTIQPFIRLDKSLSMEVTLKCIGTSTMIFLIIIATRTQLFIFDCVTLEISKICETIAPLLADKRAIKLIHDAHYTSGILQSVGIISDLNGVFDTQLVMELLNEPFNSSLKEMLDFLEINTYNAKRSLLKQFDDANSEIWEKRPLNISMFNNVSDDASFIHQAYDKILDELDDDERQHILKASQMRVEYAALTSGERHVCFDTNQKHKLASYELMKVMYPDDMSQPSPLIVSSDCSPLIELLPKDLAEWIQDKTDALFEIVLDKGRPPSAWIGQDRILINRNTVSGFVEESDISYVVKQLGRFGSDNRAGLDGQLHRVSAMRNRSNDIIGLTLRVGRHVSGNAYIISDLLYSYPNLSILFLGEPGSGKTTVVREVTRLLADFNNVCIVDTSNEIAGDGDIPHPCVGHARRMMVPTLDKQCDIMVECVQNHTPEIIVIDEIGRSNEVEAARTCKNRGVRLIASAHGDLRKLVKNPKLRGLVGGIDRVTIGDEEAKKIAKERNLPTQKTKSERGGPPTFEIIVELKRGVHNEWTIIFDSGKAVDEILEGNKYPIQRRTRNPNTGAINIVLDEA